MTTGVEIGSLIARNPSLRGGRPILAGTGTCVRSIVLDTQTGYSPEEILESRPHPSLALIHAALAYYYVNREEIDAEE